MTPLEIVTRRLANQHLTRAKFKTAQEVVECLGAVQAQDYAGARWALAQRMEQTTDAAIERAFGAGKILRTHVLRPTWHFVSPNDIRWLLALTAPRVHSFNALMYRRMELDNALLKKANTLLEKTLREGKQKTRTELETVLGQNGITAKDGFRLSLIMMHAELDGIICSGARRGKQFTYGLLAERAPRAKTLPREEALFELSKRYFATRGPATVQDFAWWSGLALRDARNGMEMVSAEFERVQVGKQIYLFPSAAPAAQQESPTALLLPNYDEYFIGFKDRRALGERIHTQPAQELNRALAAHIIFINGQVVGGWKRAIEKNLVRVELHLLTALTKSEKRAIEGSARRYAKFIGAPLALVEKTFDDKRQSGFFT